MKLSSGISCLAGCIWSERHGPAALVDGLALEQSTPLKMKRGAQETGLSKHHSPVPPALLKSLTQAGDKRPDSRNELSSVRDVREKLQASMASSACRYSAPRDSIKAYSSPLAPEASSASQSRPAVPVSSLARTHDADDSQGLTAEAAEMLQQKLAAVQEENRVLREALGSSEQRAAAYKRLVKRASKEIDQLDFYKTQAHLATGRAEVFLQARATLVKQHKKELGAARSSTQLAVQRVLHLEKQVQYLQQQQQQQQDMPSSSCSSSVPRITAPAVSRLPGSAVAEMCSSAPKLKVTPL